LTGNFQKATVEVEGDMKKREIWLPDKVDEMALAQAHAKGIDVSAFYSGLLSDYLLNGQQRKLEAATSKTRAQQVSRHDDKPTAPGSEPRKVDGRVIDQYDDRPLVECDSGEFEEVGPGKGDYVMVQEFGENSLVAGTFEKVPEGQGDWSMNIGFSHSPGVRFDVSESFPGFPRRSIQYAQRIVNEAIKIPGVVPSEYRQKNGQKIGISLRPNFLMIEALLQRKSGIRVSLYGEPDRFSEKPSSLGRGRGRYSRIVVKTDEDLEKLLPLVRQAYELKLGPVPAEDEEIII
jgi:hypothetical protein